MEVEKIMQQLEQKHPGELEYLQAVKEVLISIQDVYNQHPEFEKAKIIERIVEPERIITFRVPWVDDNGEIHVNLGYRVQFNRHSRMHLLLCQWAVVREVQTSLSVEEATQRLCVSARLS